MMANVVPYAAEGLDLFTGPFQQVQVEREYEVSYTPTVGINASSGGQLGQIEIMVHKSDSYIDMSRIYMYAEIQLLKKDNTAITDADSVSTVNNILDSAFSDVTVQFNGKSLVLSRHNFPYLSYVNKAINYQQFAKQSLLKSYGWIEDSRGHFNSSFKADHTSDNKGLVARRNLFVNKPDGIEIMSHLQIPLSNQSKYLINGVDLRFIFTRNTDAFLLMGSDHIENDYKFLIKDLKLLVTKIEPVPALISAQQQVLNEDKPINYCYKQTVLKTLHLHQGVNGINHTFAESKLPVNCLVGIVPDAAAMGAGHLNPYKFSDHGLSHLCFYLDGISYPNEAYEIDVSKGKTLRVYNAFMDHINSGLLDDRFIGIAHKDFVDNFFLIPCDFAPLDDKNTTFSIPKSGNLKCELKFHKPLPEAVTVLFFFTVECTAFVDKDKNFIFDSPV